METTLPSSLRTVAPAATAYLDWAASAPLCAAARAAMQAWLEGPGGNPASLHRQGRAARASLEQARGDVARLLGVPTEDVVLTSGGTEAVNLALLGGARARRWRDGRAHLVISAIEHAAVLSAAAWLEREGFEVTWLPCARDGRVPVASLGDAVRPDTALVVLMAVNNETGVLQPVAEAAEHAHRVGAWLLCDAVQACYGDLPARLACVVDLLTCSSHKIGGPPGAGALYCRQGCDLVPLVTGGGQEALRRGGTPGLPAIIGFGAAAREALAHRSEHLRALQDIGASLRTGLQACLPEAHLVGDSLERAAHIATWLIPGTRAETLLCALDLAGVAVSSGAACSSHSMETSHVLLAMGWPEDEAQTALRFSWGPATTMAEVEHLLVRLPELVARDRQATEAARRSLERSRRLRAGRETCP